MIRGGDSFRKIEPTTTKDTKDHEGATRIVKTGTDAEAPRYHGNNLVLYLNCGGTHPKMTQMEVAYRYAGPPTESAMRAVDGIREVYGIRRVSFNEKEQTVRVEYDASRFKEPVVAGLLRRAGVDIVERLALA